MNISGQPRATADRFVAGMRRVHAIAGSETDPTAETSLQNRGEGHFSSSFPARVLKVTTNFMILAPRNDNRGLAGYNPLPIFPNQ
jgi:hypothetical protein